MIRNATLLDIPRLAWVAKCHLQELGFIPKVQLIDALEKSELIVEDETFAFCKFHLRDDGWKTIYSIVVPMKYRGKGIGKLLIKHLGVPLRAKCPAELPSNSFYVGLGFRLASRERSPKRILNVWEKEGELKT